MQVCNKNLQAMLNHYDKHYDRENIQNTSTPKPAINILVKVPRQSRNFPPIHATCLVTAEQKVVSDVAIVRHEPLELVVLQVTRKPGHAQQVLRLRRDDGDAVAADRAASGRFRLRRMRLVRLLAGPLLPKIRPNVLDLSSRPVGSRTAHRQADHAHFQATPLQ